MTPFVLSTGDVCDDSDITYTLTEASGIDTSIFTFDDSALTLTTYTTVDAKVTLPSTIFYFTLSASADSVLVDSTTFTVTLHTKCYL